MEKRAMQLKWVKAIIAGIVILIIAGLAMKEWEKSQVVGHSQYRFNLAIIMPETGITFVSFDPSEKSVLSLPFPQNMAIGTRNSGEYSISSLYKLGSYKGQATDSKAMAAEGGMFARQKIQGFMRVPIPGYVVSSGKQRLGKASVRGPLLKVLFGKNETSLSRFDAMILISRLGHYSFREVGEEELVRSAVIENNKYHPERLQEYVGSRLFDWGIGANGVTVAIINESGENGLGSDLADFLTNLGLDVVMVRSANKDSVTDYTEWQVGSLKEAGELKYIFQNLFGFTDPKLENVGEEYRADVLIKVGKDAKELF